MAYETTTVSVSKSQDEIRDMLYRHNAHRVGFAEQGDGNGNVSIETDFVIQGRAVRMTVALKMPAERHLQAKASRSRSKTLAQVHREVYEQESRRMWRVLAWNLKARMVAVEEGVETLEQAFLAHLVLDAADGRTVYETLLDAGQVPQLEAGSN